MQNKIEWYREVLELEPSSRVFFPLARMLAEGGNHADALNVLRQGLSRHPEHFEATLLLMETLRALGREEELHREVRSLADKMAAYPSFWDAWAMALAQDGDMRDSALALSFLAARFQGEELTWSDVIEQGLKTLAGSEAPAAAARPPRREGLTVVPPLKPQAKAAASAQGEEREEADQAELDSEELDDAAALDLAAEDLDRESAAADLDNDDEGAEPEEPISYRTRTMADLLAEQGDIQGALDILKELLGRLEPGPQRDEIKARMDALSASDAAAEGEGGAVKADAGGKEGGTRALTGKRKLIQTLESLAQRLEVRAAG